MPALNPAADDDADVDKVSCESFCDLMVVADIDTPDACPPGNRCARGYVRVRVRIMKLS
jgi:hypothetical protein